MAWLLTTTSNQISQIISLSPPGGLASASQLETRRVASRAIQLYDSNPTSFGSQHVQSQRFLNKNWRGLRPSRDPYEADPALRDLVESISTRAKLIWLTEPIQKHCHFCVGLLPFGTPLACVSFTSHHIMY